MNKNQQPEITSILQDWNNGNEDAKERLIPFVYEELKKQARILMSKERPNHTLQATALVHEAFFKLSQQAGVDWQNRSHFFGISPFAGNNDLPIKFSHLHLAEFIRQIRIYLKRSYAN